jgi:hypothetical protein
MNTGISEYTSPAGKVNKGALELPKDFETTRYAAKWAKQGAGVSRAMEPEIVASEGKQIIPWSVWKNAAGQICRRALASGVFILMVRPKNIQQAANKLYGNVSRRRMVTEGEGQTIGGERNNDSGMLNNARLSREGENQTFEGQIPLNEITIEDTTVATEAVGTADEETILQASKTRKRQ